MDWVSYPLPIKNLSVKITSGVLLWSYMSIFVKNSGFPDGVQNIFTGVSSIRIMIMVVKKANLKS